MEPDEIAAEAGAVTETIVEQALENAEAREEYAAEIVEQVVESARQAEIVRTVEDRITGIEQWHGAELSRLMERLSSAEQRLSETTERLDLLTLSMQLPQPQPEPQPEPTPEPTPPEPLTLPESAEDGQRANPEGDKPVSAKRSPAKRRFW